MNHPFFANVNWEALLKREIEPPYRPVIEGRLDLRNFDPVTIFKLLYLVIH